MKTLSRSLFISIITLLMCSRAGAQTDIPMGTWRMHTSYASITCIAIGADKVYGAADNSIMVLDRTDNSMTSYSKLNGLTGSSISYINYDETSGVLLVVYADGDLDIINNNTVTNFDRLKNSTTVSGSKKINHIAMHDGLAYLSTDYGVVVFDLARREVKETWRDLGTNGTKISIVQSTFLSDSIFLATQTGVLAGNIHDNLLDFNNWKRFNQAPLNSTIKAIASFDGKVYAGIDNNGLYYYENNTWTKESSLDNTVFRSLYAATHLIIAEGSNTWKLTTPGNKQLIHDNLYTTPQFASEDAQGKLWVGDANNGLISDVSGAFMRYMLNGPTFSIAPRLKYVNNTLYALEGGYSSTFTAAGNAGDVNAFTAGQWSLQLAPVKDVTDIDVFNNNVVTASFGYGVQVGTITAPDVIYNQNNSTLINLSAGNHVNITSVETSPDGLWVANYGTATSLHLLKKDNTWTPFSFAISAARYPVELIVDYYGSVWALLNPLQGGGLLVFNQEENLIAYLTDQTDNGGMPSVSVRSIAMDRDGYVWVGTDKGIGYFVSPSRVFNTGVNLVKPIFENRYLFTNERVTAIAVDGGNRKWVGTERGAWLFNPSGEALVYNFTTENSPLPSDNILAIVIDPVSGEVFFSTDKGIASFRSDATEGGTTFKSVKVFPNPITADFNGTVGITGLADDAIVKITDVRGKLVWQSQANGGTATWNVRDYNGRRATTGMYLIFSATQDGSESFVGKVAVVD